MFAYTVTCTFRHAAMADEWIAWLRDDHLAKVIAAGALDAEIVRHDGEPVRVEVRYHFASRDDFSRYEREHAPRLRAEGLARFGPERGLIYVRSTGEVMMRS